MLPLRSVKELPRSSAGMASSVPNHGTTQVRVRPGNNHRGSGEAVASIADERELRDRYWRTGEQRNEHAR